MCVCVSKFGVAMDPNPKTLCQDDVSKCKELVYMIQWCIVLNGISKFFRVKKILIERNSDIIYSYQFIFNSHRENQEGDVRRIHLYTKALEHPMRAPCMWGWQGIQEPLWVGGGRTWLASWGCSGRWWWPRWSPA